ncbi:Neurobeachin [Eumeta japonica]|uniref:Neurobeachin n=1 Tax=Eumeta variegata TaxID=151549 RepID=A0A4C1ZU49_EUMVA|nr:Neurobeachin [Eumeta japonica]
MHEDEPARRFATLISLMSEHPSLWCPLSMLKVASGRYSKLLASESQMIRLQALKLLGFFLSTIHTSVNMTMSPHNHGTYWRCGWRGGGLALPVYNALYELLTEHVQQVLNTPSGAKLASAYPSVDKRFCSHVYIYIYI